MSKIDELIKKYCPDGVEYKTLGDIATDIYRGTGIKRTEVTETGIPCVRYGEIYTTYDIWFDECISHTDESKISNGKYFEYGDILFAITGESVEDIAKSVAYVGRDRCMAGGDIVVMKHNEDPKYLAYALSTSDARSQKSKGKVKSKVVHSSVPAIRAISVPVPPLEVQREIVRALDHFTLLSAELSAELKDRQLQYNYYRGKLLSFEDASTVRRIKLSELAEIGTGSSNTNEAEENGKYPFFVRSQSPLLKNDYEYDEKAIITAGDGVGVGQVFHYIDGKYALHQRAYRIHPISDDIIPKYLFHYFKANFYGYISKAGVHSSVSSIRKPMLDNYTIPVPSVEVQEKLVELLDNFDSICSDLNIGLPAEIEARQKQYEY